MDTRRQLCSGQTITDCPSFHLTHRSNDWVRARFCNGDKVSGARVGASPCKMTYGADTDCRIGLAEKTKYVSDLQILYGESVQKVVVVTIRRRLAAGSLVRAAATKPRPQHAGPGGLALEVRSSQGRSPLVVRQPGTTACRPPAALPAPGPARSCPASVAAGNRHRSSGGWRRTPARDRARTGARPAI